MEDFVSLHRQSQDIPIKNKAVTPRKKALALGRAVLPLFVCYEIGVCNFMNRSRAFFIPRMIFSVSCQQFGCNLLALLTIQLQLVVLGKMFLATVTIIQQNGFNLIL